MIFVSILMVCVLAVISWEDCQTRMIANKRVTVVFLLAIAYVVMRSQTMSDLFDHLLSFLYIVIPAIALFAFRIWGGGDAKLLMALAPIAQPQTLFLLIFLIVICGFFQAIIILVTRRLKPRSFYLDGMPYGVAIAFGATIFLAMDIFEAEQSEFIKVFLPIINIVI